MILQPTSQIGHHHKVTNITVTILRLMIHKLRILKFSKMALLSKKDLNVSIMKSSFFPKIGHF